MRQFSKGLFAGVAGTLLLTGGLSYAQSVTRQIDVSFLPLRYVVSGVEQAPPADRPGFVYNGSTYVSLRFVAEALGQEVTWDSATSTISLEANRSGAGSPGTSPQAPQAPAASAPRKAKIGDKLEINNGSGLYEITYNGFRYEPEPNDETMHRAMFDYTVRNVSVAESLSALGAGHGELVTSDGRGVAWTDGNWYSKHTSSLMPGETTTITAWAVLPKEVTVKALQVPRPGRRNDISGFLLELP